MSVESSILRLKISLGLLWLSIGILIFVDSSRSKLDEPNPNIEAKSRTPALDIATGLGPTNILDNSNINYVKPSFGIYQVTENGSIIYWDPLASLRISKDNNYLDLSHDSLKLRYYDDHTDITTTFYGNRIVYDNKYGNVSTFIIPDTQGYNYIATLADIELATNSLSQLAYTSSYYDIYDRPDLSTAEVSKATSANYSEYSGIALSLLGAQSNAIETAIQPLDLTQATNDLYSIVVTDLGNTTNYVDASITSATGGLAKVASSGDYSDLINIPAHGLELDVWAHRYYYYGANIIESPTNMFTINSSGVITSYNPDVGDNIIVPWSINDIKVIGLADDLFRRTIATNIVLPSTVLSVGNYAFSDSDDLVSIYLPNVSYIGNMAFHSCPSLTSVFFNCSKPTIGTNIFGSQSEATVYVNNNTCEGWSTELASRPVVRGKLYSDYHNTTEALRLETLRQYHYGSTNIIESPANWFNVSGNQITGLSGNYDNSPTIVIPWAIGGVNITKVRLGDGVSDSNHVTTKVILPLTVIELLNSAFQDFSVLNTVIAPNVEVVGDYAFASCSLTYVNLPKATKLGSFTFIESGVKIVKAPNLAMLFTFTFDCSYVTNVIVSSKPPYVESELIPLQAHPNLRITVDNPSAKGWQSEFYGIPVDRLSLTTDSLTLGDVTKTEWPLELDLKALRLYHYGSAEVVESPEEWFEFDAATGTITKFHYEAGREDVVIPWDIGGVAVVAIGGYAFYADGDDEEDNVESIQGPRSLVSLGSGAFFGCHELVAVDLPAVAAVEGSVFENCSKLKQVALPLISSVPAGLFYFCSELVEVALHAATTIGNDAFTGCTKLSSLSVPAAVTHIGSHAFADCAVTNLCFGGDYPEFAGDALQFAAAELVITVDNPAARGWPDEVQGVPVIRPSLYSDTVIASNIVATAISATNITADTIAINHTNQPIAIYPNYLKFDINLNSNTNGYNYTDFELTIFKVNNSSETWSMDNLVYYHNTTANIHPDYTNFTDNDARVYYIENSDNNYGQWILADNDNSIASQIDTNNYISLVSLYPSHDTKINWETWQQYHNSGNLRASVLRYTTEGPEVVEGTNKLRWSIIPIDWVFSRPYED